jgi:hypothetical protein
MFAPVPWHKLGAVMGVSFGMLAGAAQKGRLTLVVFALALTSGAAFAQEAGKDSAMEAYAMAPSDSNPADAADTATGSPLSPEEIAIIRNSLADDAIASDQDKPAKTLRLPHLSYPGSLDIKRTDLPNGTSAVAVKQPLPIDWDAKVGADLGLANDQSSYLPGASRAYSGSGAAWASLGVVPNLATVDARVDPGNDQGKLGTTFKHSVPLGSKFSVTLQNTLSVTETLSSPAASTAAVPALSQYWGNEKAAKFDILPTGTTLGAGLVTASNDPITHNTLSAEQKVYGPLHVTTAVTDVGQTTSSKSISAGLKLNW